MEDKLWRFVSCVLLNRGEQFELTDFRFENPVPVKLDGKLVGFCCLHDESDSTTGFNRRGVIWGEFAVEYSIPTRLDVENGAKVWTLPHVSLENWIQVSRAGSPDAAKLMPQIGKITHIELRSDCDDKNMLAIGEW